MQNHAKAVEAAESGQENIIPAQAPETVTLPETETPASETA